MIGNNKNSFPLTLLLTDWQGTSLRKTLGNKSAANIKLSNKQTKLSEIVQSGRFVNRFLGPLMNDSLPLMKNILQILVKSVLILLELTAAAAAADQESKNHFSIWNVWSSNYDTNNVRLRNG